MTPEEKILKVIHLTNGGEGGAKTHIITLLDRASKEIEIELVHFSDGKFLKDAKAAGINASHCAGMFSAVRKLKEKIATESIDIVHCHGAKANVIGAMLKLTGCKARIVTTIHSDYTKDYSNILKKYTVGLGNSLSLRLLDEYITVSDSMSDVMIKHKFDPNHILRIFNGIDFDQEKPMVDRHSFFAEKQIPYADEDVIVGIAARFDPIKDIQTLIKGFAHALKKAPNLRLVIAGEGEERNMLKNLSFTLGVSERVHFIGWISDMKTFYGAVDINTLTSKSEGFPYAVLEGANAGCATISSDFKTAVDLIEDGKEGFVFKIGHVTELGECLAELGNDKALRQEFARKLLEKCQNEFSLQRMKEVQIDIYKRLIKRNEQKGRYGVCLCGAYGRGNAGDDAILEAIVAEMKTIDRDMPIWVLSKNPLGTKLSNDVDAIYTFNLFKFINRLKKSKMFISGGGNLLQDNTSSRSLFFYLYTIILGKTFSKKVMMYGCGVGPIKRAKNLQITAQVINKYVDHITLREPDSKKFLEDMGVNTPISLSADPALNLKPKREDLIRAALEKEGIPEDDEYLCISVRNWPKFDEAAPTIARAIDYACEKHKITPIILPIELSSSKDIDNDATAIMRLASHMKTEKKLIIKNRYDARTTIGIISKAKAMLSMRLHALIFAAGQGLPTIAISYDPKVNGFMKYMGQDMCMNVGDIDEEKLKAYLDVAIERSQNNEENINQVQRLREMEFVNIKVAKELLGYPS